MTESTSTRVHLTERPRLLIRRANQNYLRVLDSNDKKQPQDIVLNVVFIGESRETKSFLDQLVAPDPIFDDAPHTPIGVWTSQKQ